MATLNLILILTLFAVATLAANNWTEPCHAGQCQWDLQSDYGSGTMLLVGSNSSISDFTLAGGWTIIDCNTTSADQEIRVVCHDPSKCDHLNLNGAENTVVRLPNDCSSEPFAVVTRVWTHMDQSIPTSTELLLERHGALQRPVQGISLSTDFASTHGSQHGNITVSIVGSSMPVFNNTTQAVPGCDATDDTLSILMPCDVPSVTHQAILSRETSESNSFPLPDAAFHKNLFQDSFSCPQSGSVPAFDGSVGVDLKGAMSGSLSYAVSYESFLSVPNLSSVSLTVGFDASLDGTVSLNADLMGSLTTGDITLFSVGLPGLDFGKIFKIGPTFNIYAEADALIETNLEVDVDLTYTITGGQLFYPPSLSPEVPGGTFTPGNSNITLSAGPNVTGNAQLAAHLKPTFEFGVSILKFTSADIYLDLDTYVELDLSITGAASGSVSTGSGGSNSSTSTGAGGCVDIFTGILVDAGAEGDVVNFSGSDKVTLFSKSFDLFKKCFGNSYQKRNNLNRHGHGNSRWRARLSSVGHNWRVHRSNNVPSKATVRRRRIVPKSKKGFSCPTAWTGALSPIISGINVNATARP